MTIGEYAALNRKCMDIVSRRLADSGLLLGDSYTATLNIVRRNTADYRDSDREVMDYTICGQSQFGGLMQRILADVREELDCEVDPVYEGAYISQD